MGKTIDNKDMLILGTVPPPMGGDAIWMLKFQYALSEKGLSFSFVNTSLIGKRAITISNKKNFVTEIKRYLLIKKSLKKELKNFKFKACHFNINCSKLGTIRDYLIAKIISKRKIPLFLHCHCNIEDQIGKNRISLTFLKKLFKKANNILTLNQKSTAFCCDLGFNNIYEIPNFVDSKSIANSHIINDKVKNVVFVGHIQEEKGIVEYLETAKQFPNIIFNVLGKNTGKFDIENYVKNNNLKNVVLLGNVRNEKVIECLDIFDVFIFPSYTEGFSLALLEAMSRGIPIIASDVGANKEMLAQNCGIIVNSKSTSDIKVALLDLINDKNKRKLYSDNCISKVLNNYNTDAIIGKLLNIYGFKQ